jgi:hypothetical protein
VNTIEQRINRGRARNVDRTASPAYRRTTEATIAAFANAAGTTRTAISAVAGDRRISAGAACRLREA